MEFEDKRIAYLINVQALFPFSNIRIRVFKNIDVFAIIRILLLSLIVNREIIAEEIVFGYLLKL